MFRNTDTEGSESKWFSTQTQKVMKFCVNPIQFIKLIFFHSKYVQGMNNKAYDFKSKGEFFQ
jgi:hypothetical protein